MSALTSESPVCFPGRVNRRIPNRIRKRTGSDSKVMDMSITLCCYGWNHEHGVYPCLLVDEKQ